MIGRSRPLRLRRLKLPKPVSGTQQQAASLPCAYPGAARLGWFPVAIRIPEGVEAAVPLVGVPPGDEDLHTLVGVHTGGGTRTSPVVRHPEAGYGDSPDRAVLDHPVQVVHRQIGQVHARINEPGAQPVRGCASRAPASSIRLRPFSLAAYSAVSARATSSSEVSVPYHVATPDAKR